eukprot:TRINITY_DN18551_c0_g1_i2.p1 TRINITY_DN18551_c0_g1~~TRINITY_DN18551_c0_g1_i2.p1  ORF type:complete len:137 (-),score=15.24 TRINITY_DN18551_c0_g1_i2:70-480(-)
MQAATWLSQMSGGDRSDDDAEVHIPEARPLRLGLGAKFLPHSQVTASMSSIEKQLRNKVSASKQYMRDSIEDPSRKQSTSSKDKGKGFKQDAMEGGESEDEEESRAKTFKKTEKREINTGNALVGLHDKKQKKRRR